MADLNQLKQKYHPVLALFDHFAPHGAQLQQVALDGDKLLIQGTVPSTVIANRIWTQSSKLTRPTRIFIIP